MLTLIMLGAAVLLYAVSYVLFMRVRRAGTSNADFLARSRTARAEVTSLREETRGGSQYAQMKDTGAPYATLFYPTVTFELPGGRRVQTELLTGASPAPARVGETMDIRFDPGDPSRAVAAQGRSSLAAAGCMATVLPVFFTGFATVLVLFWVLLKLVLHVPG